MNFFGCLPIGIAYKIPITITLHALNCDAFHADILLRTKMVRLNLQVVNGLKALGIVSLQSNVILIFYECLVPILDSIIPTEQYDMLPMKFVLL